ncbi:MAG: sulfotransferase [Chloroflexota bacterium]|nr:sulfotransferase [Chloroflexota bacterium]
MELKDWSHLKYIQIGGNHKSGTSLLSSLLDGHPDVACFPGQTSATGFLYPILRDPNVSKRAKVDAILDERCSKETDGYVPVSACDFIEVGRKLDRLMVDIDDSFANLNFALLQAFYEEFNLEHLKTAKIWMDKSPLSHLFADELFEIYPNMKFIHLLRDPKDNFASVGDSFLKRINSRVKREALLWRYRIWSAQSFYYAKWNQDKFGEDRYKVIRFRDMCLKPKAIMSDLADFIGIPEMDILYQPSRAGYFYPGNNKNGLTFDGIYAGNVDRWRERIPPYYARVMESQSAVPLNQFGYKKHFTEQERTQALRKHRIITALIPRFILTKQYDVRHFKRPDPKVPGLQT